MDTRRLLTTMALVLLVMLGWSLFINYEYGQHPEWKRPGADTQPAGPTELVAGDNPTTAPIASSSTAPSAVTVAATEPSMALIGSAVAQDPAFTVGLKIDSAGAGLDSVILNRFKQTAGSDAVYEFQGPAVIDPAQHLALATFAITVDGQRVETWNANWQQVPAAGLLSRSSLAYQIDIQLSGKPVVRVVKRFSVPKTSDPSQGYDCSIDYEVTSLDGAAHAVSVEFNGPTVPQPQGDRQALDVVAGYRSGNQLALLFNDPAEFKTAGLTKQYATNDKNQSVLWAGTSTNYFNALVRPLDEQRMATVVATGLGPDPVTAAPVVVIRFTTVDLHVPADAPVTLPMRVFFGPKQRDLLKSTYYSSMPLSYDQTLVMVTGVCSFCTFPVLIDFLVVLLRAFHFVLRDWGLAIIALVCLVRVCLHPITKRSQVSMMRMQKLAPEMERLKKKFGDDKEGLARAQADMYKEMGMSPVLGCLPTFLQMPIFIALWRSLQTTFELRQAPFLRWPGLPPLTWIKDLSEPDYLIRFSHPLPLVLFGWHLSGINLLPLLMAVVTFLNQKYLMPPPAVQSAEQEQQRKMMTYMSLLFPLMFYSFPSGLSLYYLVSAGLGIIESKRIRAHIAKQEELERAGKEFVDAGKATRGSRQQKKLGTEKPAKKGFIASFLENMEARAEQLRRESEKRKKKGLP